jgi:hypothetical protein
MAKKVIVIVISVFLLLVGAGLAAGGGALMAFFGSDNSIGSGPQHLSTQTAALVTTLDNINGSNGFGTTFNNPTLRIAVTNPDREVFIGVGPKTDVERYLAGVAIENVRDFDLDPFRLSTEQRAGDTQPAAPAGQSFWTARGSGREATLDWTISDGSYELVVMNADASRSVAVDGQFALTVPHLFAIGTGVLIAGIVVFVIGVVLLVVGIQLRARPGPTAAGPAAGAPAQQ